MEPTIRHGANGDAAAHVESHARVRVRTPGKHIVLFSLAVTFMLALSTTVLRTANLKLPADPLPEFAASKDGRYYGPPEEFLVDLSDGADGRSAYLKLTVKIVARDGAALAEIREKRPLVRERIAFFLRELSPEDLEGSENMARVKAEMLKRAGLPLGGGAATDLVIENLIVQ